MANVYRVSVVSLEPTFNNTIQANVNFEIRSGVNPDFTWTTIMQEAPIFLTFSVSEIISITNSALGNAAKRQAWHDLLKARALSKALDVSNEAVTDLNSLLTFPDQVTIRN